MVGLFHTNRCDKALRGQTVYFCRPKVKKIIPRSVRTVPFLFNLQPIPTVWQRFDVACGWGREMGANDQSVLIHQFSK